MVKEIDNIQEKLNWHWRNSMRPVRFFMLDARASLPFLVLFVYARTSTIIITIIITLIFYFFEKRGLTTPAAMRSLRVWFVGPSRPGIPSALRKRLKDYY
jgi:intracellular multiplication protein IcmT